MSLVDDISPKKQPAHDFGSDVSPLFADELSSRIGALQQKIARLDVERPSKLASRLLAESVFR